MNARLLGRLRQLGLTSAAEAQLQALTSPRQDLAPGTTIVHQGATATHLHLLEEGWAFSSRTLRDGRHQTTALALGGEFCDLDVLAINGCGSQVMALTRCNVTRLSLAALRELLEQEPSLSTALHRLSGGERLIATEWMVNLGRRSAIERIAHLLCELAVRLADAPRTEAVAFPLPMTQSDLADAAGLSVVHVNRSLQTLRREIGLTIEKRRATVPSWRALVEVAEFDPEYLGLGTFPLGDASGGKALPFAS